MSEKTIDPLIKVTSLTLQSVLPMEKVPPALYNDVFNKICQEEKVSFSSEDTTPAKLFDKLLSLEENTLKNANILTENLSKAENAIKGKDLDVLEKIHAEVTALKQQMTKLESNLYQDELTGAKNRKWLFETLAEKEHFIKDGSLAFIDLNGFKQINDTYGHNVGDKILKLFTKVLQSIKETDTIRYAGDEFMVLTKRKDPLYLEKQLKQTEEKLSKKVVSIGQDKSIKMRFSYGIVNFKPNDPCMNIIQKADELMYRDKKRKKSQR